MSRTFFASWLRRTAISPADHADGSRSDLTSHRAKMRALPLLGSDEDAFSPNTGVLSLGTGGAGTVGGFGVCR